MSDMPAKDPASPPYDKLSDHAYDGIQEYDNPTPGWWVWLFVCSVVFAFFYFIYYHADVTNRSVYDRYNDSVALNAKKKLAALGIDHLDVNEKNMLQWMTNKDYMAYGQSVFKQNCVSCHGDSGQGLVGPNMTDDYYKNIKVITDIPRVITSGANNGAMPSWARLGSIDIALVGTYIASLRGQNLPGRKPEGDKIPPWPSQPTPAPTNSPATSK